MQERLQQRILIAATTLVAATYLVGVALSSGLSKPLVQGDARSYFAYLPSLVFDTDLDLRNQFVDLRPNTDPDPYPWGRGAGDYAANPFPIGPALLWLPGYLLGAGADAIAVMAGVDTGPAGYGVLAVWGAALSAITLAGLGAELSRRLAAELVAPRYALPAALLAWVGTPALYYTMITPLYSHAVAWFATALMTWAAWGALQAPERRWRWLAAGAAAGLVIDIRMQDAPLLLVPIGLLLLADRAARARAAVHWVAGLVLGYLPQAGTWYTLHGELIPRQNLGAPAAFSLARLGAVLFSTGYEGWLSWTPLAAAGVAGLALTAFSSSRAAVEDTGPSPAAAPDAGSPPRWRAARVVARSGLVAIGMLVLIDVIHPYGQGAAFGARRYVSVTPLLIIGLAAALAACGERRRLRLPGWTLIAGLGLAGLWLLVAYELLIIRHGVYADLAGVWRYALGLGA